MRRMLILSVSFCIVLSLIVGSVLVPTDLHAGQGGGLPPPPDTTGTDSYIGGGDAEKIQFEEPTSEELSLTDLLLLYFDLIL